MSRKVNLVADMPIQDAAQETYDAIALPVRSRPLPSLPSFYAYDSKAYSSINILCMRNLHAETGSCQELRCNHANEHD